MRQSRRSFLDVLSTSGFGLRRRPWIPARGHEDYQAQAAQGGATAPATPPDVKPIRISSNENPLVRSKPAHHNLVSRFTNPAGPSGRHFC
jgi:hypothetical protein